MAKVLGESGRYVSREAVKKVRKIWMLGLISVALTSAIWGLLIGLQFRIVRISPITTTLTSLVIGLLVWLIWKWSSRKLDVLEQERMQMRKGAAGESLVAIILGDFPEEFRVINDLTTPFGNLDHVVVGPTGAFIIDTKNWRGVVSADGRGELLSNGRPTDKPFVRQFVGRMMGMKDRVKALAPGLDPFFQALFVFTSARVDARWGTTGNVNCIRDDQLFNHIVENQRSQKLTKQEVGTIAQAFLGLAHMDADFTASAALLNAPKLAAIKPNSRRVAA
jgi:hypothetical protein